MSQLLVFPTQYEASFLIEKLLFKKISQNLFAHSKYGHLLVTGPGIPATIINLTQYFHRFGVPTRAVHAGIAGAYHTSLKPGQVCFVGQDQMADLGVEDPEGQIMMLHTMDFISTDDGLTASQVFQPTTKHAVFDQLTSVKSITVNVSSGCESTINRRRETFNPDIENMETAAFYMCCNFFGCKNFEAIRAVSNPVEPRNRDNWQIESALNALTAIIEKRLLHESIPG